MESITYNLRKQNSDSDEYYKQIRLFSSKVITYVESKAGWIFPLFEKFISQNELEKIRSRGEYIVELLTMGMTWKRYLGASQTTPRLLQSMLYWLYLLRKSFRNLKPSIDFLRGCFSGIFMSPAIGSEPIDTETTIENYERLILWLKASGEFKEEVKRLNNWYLFFQTLPVIQVNEIINTSIHLTKWFNDAAEKELAEYAEGIKTFLEIKHNEYRFREDEIFTGKEPLEYYLNMVGSEIMNRGFKEGFSGTKHKVLLVPGCVRINQGNCKALIEGLDITCSGCNKNCRVNELSKTGKEKGFQVYIIPHSSGFTQWLQRWQANKDTGLIAVACLLNLVPGGYEMRELGLNAQCVLLDNCGCKNHWHEEGIPTDLNTNRVLELINN